MPDGQMEMNMTRIEGMTFADRLRFLAPKGQHGRSRKPHELYVSETSSWGVWEPWEWRNREIGRKPLLATDGSVVGERIISEPTAFGHPEWARFAKFCARYQRYHTFLTEVLPEWKPVAEFHYADNSTEVEERNKWGQTRRLMTLQPCGDACY